MIFCIIAIASRFSDDVRVRTEAQDPDTAGDEYATASRLYHQVHAASLTNVQVLILTSTFLPSSVGSGTSWLLLGMAIRALLDIGLHQEKADTDLPPFEVGKAIELDRAAGRIGITCLLLKFPFPFLHHSERFVEEPSGELSFWIASSLPIWEDQWL